jgi:hypothetical protein
MRVPFIVLKGSGSLALLVKPPDETGEQLAGTSVGAGSAVVAGGCTTVLELLGGAGGGVVAEPGIHCQYQSFWWKQVAPDTQVVGPPQPIPPPNRYETRKSDRVWS